MKRILSICLVALFTLGLAGTANATTLMSGSVGGKGAYWFGMNKGFLFNEVGFDQGPVDITAFSTLAGILSGANLPSKVSLTFMGDAADPISAKDITASTLTFYNSSNQVLLVASIAPGSGQMSMSPFVGAPGQFDLFGTYNVTGGSLFTAGLVTGELGVSFSYLTGLLTNSEDFHFTDGSFAVSQVPEPASSVLLLSSLAGIVARRKKSKLA